MCITHARHARQPRPSPAQPQWGTRPARHSTAWHAGAARVHDDDSLSTCCTPPFPFGSPICRHSFPTHTPNVPRVGHPPNQPPLPRHVPVSATSPRPPPLRPSYPTRRRHAPPACASDSIRADRPLDITPPAKMHTRTSRRVRTGSRKSAAGAGSGEGMRIRVCWREHRSSCGLPPAGRKAHNEACSAARGNMANGRCMRGMPGWRRGLAAA